MSKKATSRLRLRSSLLSGQKISNVRYESFGGIVSLEKPAAQIFVDKRLMQALGLNESEMWDSEQRCLSSPCEVHFSITNKCPLKCPHCYVDGGTAIDNELSTQEIKSAIDSFADMGVFQIAFGGGEPFSHPDMMDLAAYTRDKGIVPNITTNGFYINEKNANECSIFGQINVSLDGVSGGALKLRGEESFNSAINAIELLKKNKVNVGLNVVISADNFTHIGEICKFAATNRIKEILLLRYKPLGRGVGDYENLKLKADHLKVLVPMTQRLTKHYGTKFRMDCSLFPALAFHSLDNETLSYWGVGGCDAGNNLVSVSPSGAYKACSFCADDAGSISDIEETWHTSSHLSSFRNWSDNPASPCEFCSYLELCKGGCHPIAFRETGSFDDVDPACPIAFDFKRGIIHPALLPVEDVS
jgi:radical SAM protein with 4Fe4S-binding SPASM domain